MIAKVLEIKQNAILRWNGFNKFHQKISVYLDSGSYILKTASSPGEIKESLMLRHDVFYKELQSSTKGGMDIDRFDSSFDHLVIKEKLTNRIIGTYRISCSDFSKMSYTESEFDLKNIFNLEGPHLELGRACIQKEHRKGIVISLLWRGIIDYMNKTGSRVLFGCTSLKLNSVRDAALVYRYLYESNAIMENLISSTKPKYSIADFDFWLNIFEDGLSIEQKQLAESMVPPLLKSYLKFGAKIGSKPAYDADFDCFDFLTILKSDDIPTNMTRKFHIVH